MNWTTARELRFEGDGPVDFHHPTLSRDLKILTGDKPSIVWNDDRVILALRFHVDLTAQQQLDVEALVAAHDGAAKLGADAAVAQQRRDDLAAQKVDLLALAAKRRGGAALTAAEQARVLDYVLEHLI